MSIFFSLSVCVFFFLKRKKEFERCVQDDPGSYDKGRTVNVNMSKIWSPTLLKI